MIFSTEVLGVAPDLYFTGNGYEPLQHGYSKAPSAAMTEWQRATEKSPATALQVKLGSTPPGEDYALVLAVGVCFGTPSGAGPIEPMPHAGCGKVLAVV